MCERTNIDSCIFNETIPTKVLYIKVRMNETLIVIYADSVQAGTGGLFEGQLMQLCMLDKMLPHILQQRRMFLIRGIFVDHIPKSLMHFNAHQNMDWT